MKKKYSARGEYQPTSFYDRKEGRRPIILFILPVLMVLVVIGAIYMAYLDSLPAGNTSSEVSSAVSSRVSSDR